MFKKTKTYYLNMGKDELRKKVLTQAYKNGFGEEGNRIEDILKVKKSTIDYVLDRLHEEKYYSKLRYEINFESVGLGRFAWLFISINWDNFNYKEFVQKALAIPQINVVADVTGEFDLALRIFGPSIQSINSFVLGFEKLFEHDIINTKIYFTNKEYKRHYLTLPKIKKEKLTKIDYQILCAKNKNPKLKMQDISQKLCLHRNTVSNKWRSYWTNKILLKKTIELTTKGYNEIGLGLKAFIILKSCPGKEEFVATELEKLNDVQDLFTTLSNEIILIVRISDSEELAYFYKKFSQIKGCVKNTETIIFLSKHTKTCLTLEELNKIIEIK
jgi:DNA-binding Lrp family transcriptional regulator